MTRDELLKKLAELKDFDETETAHARADQALIDYIDDPTISEAFRAIRKWYS